jgi:integrase
LLVLFVFVVFGRFVDRNSTASKTPALQKVPGCGRVFFCDFSASQNVREPQPCGRDGLTSPGEKVVFVGRRVFRRNDQHPRVSQSEDDTHQLLLDLREELRAMREPLSAPGKTIAEIASEWLPVKLRKIASAQDFGARVRNHLLPALGSRTCETLKKRDVEAFLLDLTQKKGLSPQTANHVRDAGRQLVEDAIEHGDWAGSNPFARADPLKIPEHDYESLSREEAARLIRATPTWWQAMFALAIFLGPRRKTIFNIRRTDVDTERWLINFNKTKTGKRVKFVPVPDGLQPYLLEALEASRDCEWLFPNRFRGKRSNNAKPVNHALFSALQRAGVLRQDGRAPELTFRDLRRVSSCLHQEAGCHPWVVSKILGHSQASLALMGSPAENTTSKHYTVFSEQFVRQELNKLKL